MRTTLLFEHAQNLSASEQKEVLIFSKMPSNQLLKQDRVVLRLLFKKLQEKTADEAKIWATIQAEEHIESSAELNKIRNRLLTMLRRYALLQEIQKDTNQENLLLTKFYTSQGLKRNANAYLNKSFKIVEEAPHEYEDDLYAYYLCELKVNQQKTVRKTDPDLAKMEQYFDNFYVLSKLRLLCEKANRTYIVSDALSTEAFFNSIATQIEYLKSIADSAIINLYFNMLNMLQHPTKKNYELVKQQWKVLCEDLSLKMREEVLAYMTNHCIRKINYVETVEEYAVEYLYVTKLRMDYGLFLDNQGKLLPTTFKNCIANGLIVQKKEWGYPFVECYSDYLPNTDSFNRAAFVELNTALLDLYNGNLENCEAAINGHRRMQVSLKDYYFKITYDKIYLKLYYEKGNLKEEAYRGKIDAFRKYIENLPAQRMQRQQHFITYLKKLVSGKPLDLQKIKETVVPLDYIWFEKVLRK